MDITIADIEREILKVETLPYPKEAHDWTLDDDVFHKVKVAIPGATRVQFNHAVKVLIVAGVIDSRPIIEDDGLAPKKTKLKRNNANALRTYRKFRPQKLGRSLSPSESLVAEKHSKDIRALK